VFVHMKCVWAGVERISCLCAEGWVVCVCVDEFGWCVRVCGTVCAVGVC
jgi:hypothetical protein